MDRWLIMRALPLGHWLRAHRTGHAVLLVASLVAVASFPFWRQGDEPFDLVVAFLGVIAFGGTLLGVLTNSEGYRAWRHGFEVIDYVVTRHAPVQGVDDIQWVSIARWVHADGCIAWGLVYGDDGGEDELGVEAADEAAAMRYAREEFGIEATAWRAGPQPCDRQEPERA